MRSAHLSVVSAQQGKAANVPAVELRDVSKTFKSRNANVDVLSGVNLSLASGEFLAIVGPSGSGKSTVLNLLAGLDQPSARSRQVSGQTHRRSQHGDRLPHPA